MFRDSAPQHHLRQRFDHLQASQPSGHADRQALPRVFVQQHQQPQRPSIVGHRFHEIIGPDVVGPLRPQPHTGPIVQPQSPSWPLFLRHFQSFSPPDPLHPILAHRPTSLVQLDGNPPVAVAAVLTGQGNNRSGQLVFVRSVNPLVALRPSPLPQQPAGMPLGKLIDLPGMPDRATPPLRA